MRPVIRQPTVQELPDLGELCMRSKAVWGYDSKFMEASRAELSLEPRDLLLTQIAVAEQQNRTVGVVQLKMIGNEADLLKLFVDPAFLRSGVGKALFSWAAGTAKEMGASRLTIEADPEAAEFYRRLGARDIGLAPSGSIAGRMLPRLAFDLS